MGTPCRHARQGHRGNADLSIEAGRLRDECHPGMTVWILINIISMSFNFIFETIVKILAEPSSLGPQSSAAGCSRS